MPKRTDLHKILLIGSGPIIIGQACEFDYSGTQACKALREEGYSVVLVNSNPATIMTDPETADRTYIEPITWQVVEKIIAKERPDALLPTLGGQTGLNTAMDLHKHGILVKYGVEMIELVTTPATDNILEGIVRSKVIRIASDEKIPFEIRRVDRTELYLADEAFLCGTGVQISPITSIDRRPVGSGEVGPIARRISRIYFEAVRGKNAKYKDWLTPVYPSAR